jgi:hypothetical protein
MGATPGAFVREFIVESILKSDEFSTSERGHFADAPEVALVRRSIGGLPWWAAPIARRLLRREARALAACRGLSGVPQLVAADRTSLIRTWSEGQPLHFARPAHAAFYRDAARLLRALRRAGITHNDLAKPQNWLMTAEGGAALIDFQLARLHRRRGWRYRVMAYEDLRHLLKQKRSFAPDLMTPGEWRLVGRRSLPGRIWRATGKRLYEWVTRDLLDWSDGEGQGGRIERDGPATEAALLAEPGVRAVALVPYARAGRRAGLCAFCEAEAGVDGAALTLAQRARGGTADLVVVAPALPRDRRGMVRQEVLKRLLEEADAGTDADGRVLAAAVVRAAQA